MDIKLVEPMILTAPYDPRRMGSCGCSCGSTIGTGSGGCCICGSHTGKGA